VKLTEYSVGSILPIGPRRRCTSLWLLSCLTGQLGAGSDADRRGLLPCASLPAPRLCPPKHWPGPMAAARLRQRSSGATEDKTCILQTQASPRMQVVEVEGSRIGRGRQHFWWSPLCLSPSRPGLVLPTLPPLHMRPKTAPGHAAGKEMLGPKGAVDGVEARTWLG
jgi:hypothetical protein